MKRVNNSVNSLNNSLTKQKYSFPKSSRFQSQSNQETDHFYNLPSVRSRRSTSFGYGHKDIGLKFEKIWPTPESYHIQSEFEKTKKGFSFGEGREDMKLTGFLGDSITKRYIPSPTNYSPKHPTPVQNVTIKSRLKDTSLDQLKKNPGPGSYNMQEMGSSNYYITSKNANKINYKMSQSPRRDLTEQQGNKIKVGPGSYELKGTDMNCEGNYFNSKLKNSQASKFSKELRPAPIIKHLLQTPGPTKQQLLSYPQ